MIQSSSLAYSSPRYIYHQCMLIIVFAMLNAGNSFSQNIFDYDHSSSYGHYLFNTGRYNWAAEEFERSLYLKPGDDSLKLMLVSAYLNDKQYDKAFNRIKIFYPDTKRMSSALAYDYTKALLLSDSFSLAGNLLLQPDFLKNDDSRFLEFNLELLKGNYPEAIKHFETDKSFYLNRNPAYESLLKRIQSEKQKSPAVAVCLSAIIPGMGKIYTKDWKDGLVSLLFVGATALQAVRGYDQYGPKSGYFIGYAGVASAFYLGNLYGAYKSARNYNAQKKKQVSQVVSAALDYSR